MKRKLTAICLTVCLAACTLGGCGTKSNDPAPAPDSASEEQESSAPDTSAEAETEVETNTETEYPVIKINYATLSEMADETLVEEEINKIMREKAGAEIDLIPVLGGNYQTTMNLLLTGGDDSLDVFTSFWYTSESNLVANGQVIALDELLDQYGQELKDLYKGYEDFLYCGKVNGQLYGIPSIGAWCSENFYVVKEDVSKAANIDWSKVNDLDTLTDAMIAMKQASPASYFIPGSTQTYWMPKNIDCLGDNNMFAVLTDPLNSTTVENYYESDTFIDFLEHVKIWKEKDLISPDPLSNSNATLVNLQYGITDGTPGFSWDSASNISYIEIQKNLDLTGGAITGSMVTTGNVTDYLWHISAFCKHPEEAMKVLVVMYTDPVVANLLANGIEGRNYVINSDGQMQLPEGVTSAADLGWQIGSNTVWPNSTLCMTWDYEAKDLYEKMEEKKNNASKSLALGFQFDSTAVVDEMTACANVVAQYYLPLMYGEVDIDSTLPIFQQALKDAGIDKIISEKQAQLDKWLSEQ